MFKAAFFDFDRTLFSHDYPSRISRQSSGVDDYYDDCLSELKNHDEMHKGDRPVPQVIDFLSRCIMRGIDCACLTHETSSLRSDYKKELLESHCFDIPYYAVNSAENKISFMCAYCAYKGLQHEEVILVDDRMDTVYLANDAGFIGYHLSDILTHTTEELLTL